MIKVKIKKLDENAEIPKYKTEGSVGMDLYSVEDVSLPPGGIKLIKTGISIEIPPGFEAQVRPRSGLAVKGVTVVNAPGTIDSDYRGEIKVILTNLNDNVFKITKKDRIAQLVFAKYERCEFELSKELSDTKRGSGGFGSTGRNDNSN